MATFDWNDLELTNIIWGEAGESDDHIVPYPNQNEEKHLILFGDLSNKETDIETSGVSPIEQKKSPTNTNRQVELANNSKYSICDHSPRFGLDSRPDVSDTSVIDVEKSDPDILGTDESNNVTTSLEGGFSIDEIPQFGKVSEYLQNSSEDTEKSDYVGYDWANIESFDDLDRIFNNDNPIFGDINVGCTDESWSSCKDGNSCPSKLTPSSSDSSNLPLGALRSMSDASNDKPQYKLDLEESFLSVYEKFIHFSQNPGIDEKSQMLPKQPDDCNAATVNVFPVKVFSSTLCGATLVLEKEFNPHFIVRLLSEAWTGFNVRCVWNSVMPLVLSQQKKVQSTKPSQRKNFSGPLLAPSFNGNMMHRYSSRSHLLSKFQPIEKNSILACANPVKKSVDAAMNPPVMTPEEKIEKLRRRQQLRVILAVQKQQQQFGNPVSVENSSIEGGNVEVDENISGFPSLDHNSAIAHDGNNAVTRPFSICSMEESIIRRLQDSISKLDMQTSLCIRDSLFRLASGAIQRHCPGDTSSVNNSTRDEIIKDADNHEGFTRIPDVERNTNLVDRIVAHLLFHTPIESSAEALESPDTLVSITPFYERKPNSTKSLANTFVPERIESPQVMFPHAPKFPSTNDEKGRSKNVPCLDAVENASRYEATTAIEHVNAESSKS